MRLEYDRWPVWSYADLVQNQLYELVAHQPGGIPRPTLTNLCPYRSLTSSYADDPSSPQLHDSYSAMKTALIDDSRFIRNAVNDRLRAAFDEGGESSGVDTTDGSAFWGQAFGSWGQIDGDGNAASLDHSTGGLLFGADVPVFDDWRLGAVAGYSNTNVDVTGRQSSGSSDNYYFGLYGGAQWGDFALRTGAAYTLHDISTTRIIAVPGVSDSVKSDYTVSAIFSSCTWMRLGRLVSIMEVMDTSAMLPSHHGAA